MQRGEDDPGDGQADGATLPVGRVTEFWAELTRQQQDDYFAALLLSLGAQEVESVPFTPEMAHLSTEQFVDLLNEKWGVRGLVVGYNS